MAIGLLETEFNKEAKELFRIESPRNMSALGVVEQRRDTRRETN